MQIARLFMNGRSQAVRLPREFQFEGQAVWIKRTSHGVLLIPMQSSWQMLLDSLDQFSADFMEERAQPTEQQERAGWLA
jgi:antitoxin VapB